MEREGYIQKAGSHIDTRWKKVGRYLTRLSCAGVLGTLGLLAVDSNQFTTDRLGLEASAETILSNKTTLHTPLGGMELPNHVGPFGLDIRINGIAFDRALELLRNADNLGQLPQDLEHDLAQITQEVRNQVEKELFFFTLGSFVGWIVGEGLTKRNEEGRKVLEKKGAARALLSAILLGSLSGGLTLKAYSEDNFETAKRSRGFSFVEDNYDLLKKLDEHDETVAKTVEGFLRLSGAISKLDEDPAAPSVCLMVVSDIHSRNVFSLMKSIIDTNCVDAVVDAGDITEGIFPSESDFFTSPSQSEQWRSIKTELEDLGVPYFIVKGNHDSESTMEDLDSLANVTVLEGQSVIVEGLKITGIGDPDYSPDDPFNEIDGRAQINEDLAKELQSLVKLYDSDIAVIHNNLAAEKVTSGVRMVISGHSHVCEPVIKVHESGTIYYNEGTSGGAFLRTFQPNDCSAGDEEGQEQPQTISILYFNDANQPYAVDEIIIKSLDGRLDMQVNNRLIPCSGDCLKIDSVNEE